MLSDEARELWKYAPVVLILLLVLWAGHKQWWYWGHGTREMITRLRSERDEWRLLALALLRKQGIELPEKVPQDTVRAYRTRLENGDE